MWHTCVSRNKRSRSTKTIGSIALSSRVSAPSPLIVVMASPREIADFTAAAGLDLVGAATMSTSVSTTT